jgi:hypothetical protein
MADFSANDLFKNLQGFKSKYVKEDMQGRENDVTILLEMSHLLELDLKFTFNPVKEASFVGFHAPGSKE